MITWTLIERAMVASLVRLLQNSKVENVVKIVINKVGESAYRSVYNIALTLEIQGPFQLLVKIKR